MNIIHKKKFQSAALTAVLSVTLLAGCDQAEQPVDSTENQANIDQSQDEDRPSEHVVEFDDFTLRVNVSPTERLPEAMAEQYGFEADPSLLLLNVVIMEKRQDEPSVPVAGEVTARYENLSGHESVIDMRAAEADGFISHIGTIDGSGQLVFRFVIEAQPEGADEPLETEFEAQLPPRDVN